MIDLPDFLDSKIGDAYMIEMGFVETRHALSLRIYTGDPPITVGQTRFRNPGKNNLSTIIGGYKSAVSKEAHRAGFDFQWQSRFHDHIIRDSDEYERIVRYILNNPENWKDDKFYPT